MEALKYLFPSVPATFHTFCMLHHGVTKSFRAVLKGAHRNHSLNTEQGDLNLTPRPCAGNKAQMYQSLKCLFLLCVHRHLQTGVFFQLKVTLPIRFLVRCAFSFHAEGT